MTHLWWHFALPACSVGMAPLRDRRCSRSGTGARKKRGENGRKGCHRRQTDRGRRPEGHRRPVEDRTAVTVAFMPLVSPELSTSLGRYLARRRLCHGEQMLRTSFLSVTEIGAACGFRNVAHFCRRFRETMGRLQECTGGAAASGNE